MQIPITELDSANKELSFKAYKLFMYYFSKNQGWVFDDLAICEYLEFSKRTFQSARKELTDKNFLLIVKGRITNYFIGKSAVQTQLNSANASVNRKKVKVNES